MNKINKGVAIIMTHDKETLINMLKLNASFLADAKKLDEVTCALDIVQSLAWQLEEILQQEKSAPAAATTEADNDDISEPVYLTEEQMSSLPLHTRVITPDGSGTFEGMDIMHGEAYVNLDNGKLHTYVPFDTKLEPCKEDE
jgi:hypothetical protein